MPLSGIISNTGIQTQAVDHGLANNFSKATGSVGGEVGNARVNPVVPMRVDKAISRPPFMMLGVTALGSLGTLALGHTSELTIG
ncbi:hypothetical protein D3C84_1182110 [compost metagenome]